MPRVHFVKKARRKHGEIKKGESYYWWKFRRGGKRTSKTPPKPSQLTQSEFWGTVLAMSERDTPDFDDLVSVRDEIVSELESLYDDTSSKKDNVESGFPNGSPIIDMLEERCNAVEECKDTIENIDCEPEIDEEEDAPEGETEEAKTERVDKLKEEKAEEIWNEITDALGSISCE